MYASIQNIRHKTDEELRRLHVCGIGGLDIGVESGLDAALQYQSRIPNRRQQDQTQNFAGIHGQYWPSEQLFFCGA
jgi:hypothetical protein